MFEMVDSKNKATENSRWNSAIYALQTFSSLLNENDKLVVDSVAKDQKLSYTANDLSQKTLNDFFKECLKNHTTNASTDFENVVKLYEKMVENESNVFTAEKELWFVVVTDGKFEWKGKRNPRDDIYEFLKDTVAAKPLGGKVPQVLYLTICGTDEMLIDQYIADDRDNGENVRIYTYNTPTVTGILQTMEDISDFISGRIRYSRNDYDVDGSSITFKTDIPLRDVVVLIQSRNDTIGEISLSGARLSRKGDIVSPAKNMRAFMRQFQKEGNGNFQPGTYTLNLGKEPGKDDVITLLFQPALVVRNSYTVIDRYGNSFDLDAEGLANSKKIFEDSSVVTHVHVYEAGQTGTEYPISGLLGGNAEVSVSAVLPDKQEVDLAKDSGLDYDFTYTAKTKGRNALRTKVSLKKYNIELRREDVFQVTEANKDPLYPIAGVSTDLQSKTVSQLTMAREGAEIVFHLETQDGISIQSPEQYVKRGLLTASLTGPDGVSHPVDKYEYSSADPTRVTLKLPPAQGFQAGKYQVALNLGDRLQASCALEVNPSKLSLKADGGDSVTLSRLKLGNGSAEIPFRLFDGGSEVKGVAEIRVTVSPASKAFSWSKGTLTVRSDSALAAGVYSIAAEKYCGLPVSCDARVTITEGEDEIAVSGGKQTLTQVAMFEKGAVASFDLTYQGRALTAQEVDALIREKKLSVSAANGAISIGSLQAAAGKVFCDVKAAWMASGEYTVTLTVHGNGQKAESRIEVQKSAFEAEISPTLVAYDDLRAGKAEIRLCALRETGSAASLDIGKYQAVLRGNNTGTWNEKSQTFTLDSQLDSKDPVILEYLVKGQAQGQLSVTVDDPLKGVVSTQSTDGAAVSVSQWTLLYGPGETVLHFPLQDDTGKPVPLEKVNALKSLFSVEGPDGLQTSLAAEQGGLALTVRPEDCKSYRELPKGDFTFVLKRDSEDFGRAALHIDPSDVEAKIYSPAVQWSAFRNNGSMTVSLSLWDGNKPLNAKTYGLTAGVEFPSGQKQPSPKADYADDGANFAISYPKDFAQGSVLILNPSAMGEALPQIKLQPNNASYEVRIEPENGGAIRQSALLQGLRFSVQVLEDGYAIALSPDILKVSSDTLSIALAGTDKSKKTVYYTVSCEDLTLAPGNYPVEVSYPSTLGKAWSDTCVLTVADSDYQVTANTPALIIEARDITKQDGCYVLFAVTQDGGQKVPMDQLLSLFSSLPEKAEGTEDVSLAWSAPEDGVLRCDATTTLGMQDFDSEKNYTLACALKNGVAAQTVLTVKKVYYAVKSDGAGGDLVHTRLHEPDQASVRFMVVYTNENGDELEPVSSTILEQWVEEGRFYLSYDYKPQDGIWQSLSNFFRMGRDRLRLRLEPTGTDGEIKAYAQGVWNYTGLWGLEGFYHHAGDRWFVPIGTVETHISLNSNGSQGASAVFRIIRDEPLKEWGLYFALPIYIVLCFLRALFKRKFPWRRLRVSALDVTDDNNGESLSYIFTTAKGFFWRKVLGFFLWPVTLPINLLLLFTKDHANIWIQKSITVGDIRVKVRAVGRTPFHDNGIEVILNSGISVCQGQQLMLPDGTPQTEISTWQMNFSSYQSTNDDDDSYSIILSDRADVLYLKEGGETPSYGILMKSKI